jgi:putative membrane protein
VSRLRKIDRIREHQANERTFLAWLRTSIALIGFGFAIARFGLFLRQLDSVVNQQQPIPHPVFNSENLGISLVVLGIVTIVFAAWRYNQVYRQIEREEYYPNRVIVWILTVVVTILGSFTIPLLLLRDAATPRTRISQPPLRNSTGASKPIPPE